MYENIVYVLDSSKVLGEIRGSGRIFITHNYLEARGARTIRYALKKKTKQK